MDIKWKVQVLDKMFDDTYVRNLYLKMKYNTLGRFSFDIRDFGTVEVESYFAVGNTIRIFWGDILKMEGVIQKLVRSTTSWGWSIYGCDLNGLLLDRTPNMPYELGCDTLTIANSVMYAGCDFPTSMWGVSDGEEQGAYVLRYKVGLNTSYKHLRNLPHDLTWQTSTGGEGGIVSSVTPTSIVDNTKTWVVDQWKGAPVRMISGARKNAVFQVLSNTSNTLVIDTETLPYRPNPNNTTLLPEGSVVIKAEAFGGIWPDYTPLNPSDIIIVSILDNIDHKYTSTVYSLSGAYLYSYFSYYAWSSNDWGGPDGWGECIHISPGDTQNGVYCPYGGRGLYYPQGWPNLVLPFLRGGDLFPGVVFESGDESISNDYTTGIVPGDLYELTKGQTITWTKKYKVTPITMTKNMHVINYNHTKDASKTHNSISVSGRDDNGGQIYTSLDDSSPITTLLSQESILSAPISASDTTIPVHDTTGFASSGEAWIE